MIDKIVRFIPLRFRAVKFERKNCISKICRMSHLLKQIPVVICSLLMFGTVQAQTPNPPATGDTLVLFAREGNGLNAVFHKMTNAPNILLTYNVKIGPVYEDDTARGISYLLQGIIADKIKNYLSDFRNPINLKNTSFNAYNTPELTVYQFIIPNDKYAATLTLLRDTINFSIISKDELTNRLQKVRTEIEADKKNYLSELDFELTQKLYRKDAYRQLIKGDTASFSNIDLQRIRDFYSKYYVPNTSIIAVTGNFDPLKYQQIMADTFNMLLKGKFDPQVVNHIVDFKAMIYNTRLIIKAPVQQPEIQICWQFPGARSNTRSSYYAFLLTAVLNEPNNYIQVKARKLGCRKLFFDYQANNFSGVLKVIIDPDKKNFYQTYSLVLNELQRLDKTLVNESTLNAGKVILKKQTEQIRKSRDYASYLTRYWIYSDESYFPTLLDSVMNQNEDRMRAFVIEYLKRSQYTTAILVNDSDRAELQLDSLLPPLNDSANNYTFTYRTNIYNLEGTENFSKLYNLLAWLRENPDLEIQVNGMADRKEVSRFHDDSIEQFIDSLPTFERSRNALVKNKNMRLEMLRSMTIIKFLYDHGIEAYRLKGTSMCFSSKNKEEEKKNMASNISITKIIRAPSLYEYHFGKPKEPIQPRY